jgi:predicted membrane chloride channel (bestrophin family)
MNINRTRDLVRQANVYYDDTNVSPEQRKDDLHHTALCTWAFVRAMKRHLSPEEEDEDMFCQELYDKLPKQQAEMIIGAAHRPNRALQDLSYAIDDLPMHFLRKNEIHKSLTTFEDNLGSSERLLTSPVPLFYSRHLTRFLAIWLLLLPFALYDTFAASWNHIGMIPATAVISIFLFGIEELGTQLEEPFTILPMQAFCDKIYNWCMEIVKWTPGDNGRPMKPVRVEHASFMPGVPLMDPYYNMAPPPPMTNGYYNAPMDAATNGDLSGFNDGYYMEPAPNGAPPPSSSYPDPTPPQPSSNWASNANSNYADAQKMSFTEFLKSQGKTQ